jgi:hypothetical protein
MCSGRFYVQHCSSPFVWCWGSCMLRQVLHHRAPAPAPSTFNCSCTWILVHGGSMYIMRFRSYMTWSLTYWNSKITQVVKNLVTHFLDCLNLKNILCFIQSRLLCFIMDHKTVWLTHTFQTVEIIVFYKRSRGPTYLFLNYKSCWFGPSWCLSDFVGILFLYLCNCWSSKY